VTERAARTSIAEILGAHLCHVHTQNTLGVSADLLGTGNLLRDLAANRSNAKLLEAAKTARDTGVMPERARAIFRVEGDTLTMDPDTAVNALLGPKEANKYRDNLQILARGITSTQRTKQQETYRRTMRIRLQTFCTRAKLQAGREKTNHQIRWLEDGNWKVSFTPEKSV